LCFSFGKYSFYLSFITCCSLYSNNINFPVNEKTELIKNYRYIIDKKEVFVDKIREKAGNEILGMNREDVEKYFNAQGLILIGYSEKEIEVSKDVYDIWPKGFYVLKTEGDFIKIFKVDEEGKLEAFEDTEMNLDLVPDGDKEEIIRGKVYKTIEEARRYIEEDLSS
jgi:fibrillarin-like rRNA methylase